MASSVRPAQTIEGLVAWIQQLENRIEALERRSEAQPGFAERAQIGPVAEPSFAVSGGMFVSLGRALLVFAGAYLLRAGAESGVIPQKLGIAAGLIYALFWLAWPVQTKVQDRFAQSLYGLTAVLCFGAMLWENTIRVQVMPPVLSAALTAVLAITGLVLAAPIAMLASAGLAVLFLFATRAVVPFAGAALAMAVATEYVVCRGRSVATRWIVALAANLSVAALLFVAARTSIAPWIGIGIPVGLVMIYGGSAVYRSLVQDLDTQWLETGEIATAFTLFAVGSLVLARPVVALFSLGSSGACYGLAVVFLSRARTRNLNIYASFALALDVIGMWAALSGLRLTAAYCALSLAMVLVRPSARKAAFEFHTPVYLLSAALASGLAVYGTRQMIGATADGPGSQAFGMVLTMLTCAACYGILTMAHCYIPAAVSLALLCLGLLGYAAAVVPAQVGLISVVALGLASAGTRWHRPECGWLVYPLMVMGASRLLLFDFQSGRPALIALSLLFYGGTLWLLPRLMRKPQLTAL
jgi:hypothetical protein